MKARNDLLPERNGFVFRFSSTPPDFFYVRREGVHRLKPSSIRFTLGGGEIHIQSEQGDLNLKVGVTLIAEGEYKCVIDGKELPDWYVRKLALEQCFFGPMF